MYCLSDFYSCLLFRHKISLAYPPHGPTDRFKVVKIVTSISLRRGRWNVVDYPDKEKTTTSKETTQHHPPPVPSAVVPAAVVQPAVSIAQATPAVPPLQQPAVTAGDPSKSETDSNASSLQPQQPNFVGGASTLVPTAATLQTAAAAAQPVADPALAQRAPMNTVRTVPNNLHNLGAMPAQTSPADANVGVTTHHTFASSQVSFQKARLWLLVTNLQ